MSKPVGGRGKKAPYETTHMRVPVELKAEFEQRIAQYRDTVLTGEESSDEVESSGMFENCLKLVNRFIEEKGQADKLTQRNNTNLVRFRDWLMQHIDGE